MINIDYKEIGDCYWNIIQKIYKCLNNDKPPEYNNESHNFTYSKEYLNAHAYLQKAEWRLGDTDEMKKYWGEEDFMHFGLENLLNVRQRIMHYLDDTSFHFPDCVYDYKKYDDIVIDFYTPLRKDKHHRDKFKLYLKLSYRESKLIHIDFLIKEYKRDIAELEGYLTDKSFLDKLSYEELEEICEGLEKHHFNMNELFLRAYEFEGE